MKKFQKALIFLTLLFTLVFSCFFFTDIKAETKQNVKYIKILEETQEKPKEESAKKDETSNQKKPFFQDSKILIPTVLVALILATISSFLYSKLTNKFKILLKIIRENNKITLEELSKESNIDQKEIRALFNNFFAKRYIETNLMTHKISGNIKTDNFVIIKKSNSEISAYKQKKLTRTQNFHIYLASNDFTITKVANYETNEVISNYDLDDIVSDISTLYIDEYKNKFSISKQDENINYSIFNFKDIENYKIYKDKKLIDINSKIYQVLQGKKFEKSKESRKEKEFVRNLQIIINLNTKEQKLIIDIINDKLFLYDDKKLYALFKSTKYLLDQLDHIIENKDNPILLDTKKEEEIKSNEKTIFEELREYKKLLDENIITQEEFDLKKKELLKNEK